MRSLLLALLLLAACGDNRSAPPECVDGWSQWGGGPAHAGASCARGQSIDRALADVVYDPLVPDEESDWFGELVIHYQSPLIDGDNVYMMQKGGTYTHCPIGPNGPDCTQDLYFRRTQTWSEIAYQWSGDTLTPQWTYTSDYQPPPYPFFEPMFQPALDGDVIAIPAAGGTLAIVDRQRGVLVRQVNPFSTIDPDTYVAGGVAVAPDGTIYYTTISLDHDNPWNADARGSSLVAVAPDFTTRTLDLTKAIPGAPSPTGACEYAYDSTRYARPWPPPAKPDGTLPAPQFGACGTQRAGVNATPAIGPDGRVFVVTTAQFNNRYSYVVAIAPDLTVMWARSLRGLLDDGCGVLVRDDGTATEHRFDCRVGAPTGVDPSTGGPPAAMVIDDSSSSPVALADGGVIYGAYTGYNGSRGHLFRFDENGAPMGNFDFGWDTTPAVIEDGRHLRVVVKNNHYGVDANGVDLGPYSITSLNGDLSPHWQYVNTDTQSCVHQTDGTVTCTDDHPHGFEWCINAPLLDADGVFYGNAEDGWLYRIDATGKELGRFFLDQAEGAAYTPIALDHAGRVYAMNNGHLVVVGAN